MNKIVSLILSVIYLIIAFFNGGSELLIKTFLFLLLPLACIWFGEEMGKYTGPTFGIKPHITKESPGCLVVLMGWVLLILPLVLFIINLFIK